MGDIRHMPWGQLVLTLQARADSYDTDDDKPREATSEEIFSFFGH